MFKVFTIVTKKSRVNDNDAYSVIVFLIMD